LYVIGEGKMQHFPGDLDEAIKVKIINVVSLDLIKHHTMATYGSKCITPPFLSSEMNG
jgi:hypothetical protein